MAVTFIASSQAKANNATSVVVPKPVGVTSGDLLLLFTNGVSQSTAPAGWTLLDYNGASFQDATVFYKIAGAGEPSSYTVSFASSGTITATCAAYRGVDQANPIDVWAVAVETSAYRTSFSAPSVNTLTEHAYVLRLLAGTDLSSLTTPSGHVLREFADNGAPYNGGAAHFDKGVQAATGATGTATASWTSNERPAFYTIALRNGNNPPNAPTLTTLVGGEVIDRAAVNRASHSFSDPDAGDSQSAFDHRHRLIGSATWTTAYVASPNSFVDYPAGTFAAGDYERQVRTYDAMGVAGPWSPSGFFSAADAPATPTITDPVQNGTIGLDSADVTWSAPQQDAYQLQVLDGGLVEHDTGTVVTTQRTAYGVPFPDNDVSRSIRVRVRYGGLWSSWYTVAVTVSYTPPPTPVVQLFNSGTAIVVQVTNPAPGAGEPAVVQNDLFVTEDGQEQRRAVLTPNGSWTYWLPKAGLDYSGLVRVEAIGDNGIRASS